MQCQARTFHEYELLIHLPCDFKELTSLKASISSSVKGNDSLSWDWQGIYEKITHENPFAWLMALATVIPAVYNQHQGSENPTVSLGLCTQAHFQVYKKHFQHDVFNEKRWN